MRPVARARRLRREATDAEQRMWSRLRNGQIRGLKFRRQMPVGRFIADFGCISARIVIEVDGGQHADRIEQDRQRTREIEGAGYLVLRFWNEDIMRDIDGVLVAIGQALEARGLSPVG